MIETVDFYREILDNLYDGVFFVDTAGKITYWNHGATALTGYRHKDVINRNCCEFFKSWDNLAADMAAGNACPVCTALKSEMMMEAEAYFRHKEGHLVPVSIRVAPGREVDRHFVVAVEIHCTSSPRYALRQRLEELQEMALHDPLTGIANRRFLEMSLAARFEEFKRYGVPFAVMCMDADNFKQINDQYGHVAGDRVLKMITGTIVNSLRSFDVIGRWGGEEFLGLLINLSEKELFPVVDRLRKLVESSQLTLDDDTPLAVTVSIGATCAQPDDTLEKVVERADKLMYESKRRGRNLVSVG